MDSSTCNNYVRLSQFYCATTFSDHENNSTALLKNIIRQIEEINYAIPEGSPVERHKPEYVGFTALHFAVLAHNSTAVKLLLERGANPMLKSRDSYSPLRLAAENSWKNQRRCLDLQGRLKHPILELLLSAQVRSGNAANISCKNGVSHFHLACMLDHDDAVKFFLNADSAFVNQVVNCDSPMLPGYTPLHIAVRYGSFKVTHLLLENGANPTLVNAAGITPLQLLVERNLKLIDVISTEDKYVHAELREELKINEQILGLLLSKFKTDGTDLGMLELHAICATRTINVEAIETIIQRGGNVNATIDFKSPVYPGYTALHIAAHFNIQTVMLLLKHGADVSIKDTRGVTPFDICVSHYKPEDVSCIIESVKSLKDISFMDDTELLDAVLMIGDPTLIDESQFRNQVTLDSRLWAGYTVLHLAVEFARKVDCVDDSIKNYEHYGADRLIPKGKVDELSTRVVKECSKFIDISIQSASGMTALHLAFRQQKRDLVNLLLDEIENKGMKTNPSDFGNLTHLHIMCVEGRVSIIHTYLNCCNGEINLNEAIQTAFQWHTIFSEPSYARPGSTALHLAVIFQKPEIAELLLKHGADPLIKDADGLTPLQLAFATDRLQGCMRDILLSGLKSKNVNPVSNEGLSHFHIACFLNDLSLVEELLNHGLADLEAPINCGLRDTHKDRPEAIKTSEYYTSQYDCSDNFLPLAPFAGFRALHMAIEGQAVEIVELLLSHGADTQARNAAGLTPLQLSLRHMHSNERFSDIVTNLMENQVEHEDVTTLHVACLQKNKAAIEKALENGVDVDAQLAQDSPIWPGSTALHLLFEGDLRWNSFESALDLLVRLDANINQSNFENSTPIHLAYNRDCLPAVKVMLQSSRIFESNPVDNEGLSHFHIICAFAEDIIVEEFLNRGLANVNQSKDYFITGNSPGFAPLDFALVYGKYSTVELLMQYGANVLAEDCYKSTLLHKAVREMSSANIHEIGVLSSILANANVNAMDIFGKTPLELCLKNGTGELLQLFLNTGVRVNIINPVSQEGLLTMIDYSILQYVLENAKNIAQIDPDTGINAIHNIVSSHKIQIDYLGLRSVIEYLIEIGCDINHQDAEGRTPLHVAIKWKNPIAVKVLLDFGADINLVDNAGNTPVTYCQCFNQIRAILLSHLDLMVQFSLYVSAANKEHYDKLRKKYDNLNKIDGLIERHRGCSIPVSSDRVSVELEQMRKIVIFKGCRLCDLLSEKFIIAYPRFEESKRQAIARSIRCVSHKKFTSLGCLLRLQHGRALARLPLIEPAKESLQLCALSMHSLSDFQTLPELCTEKIITFLRNEDLINLIQINR